MNNKVLIRIYKGLCAGGYAQTVTTGIQFLSVPLLIAAWGVVGYGEWLAVSALPVYMGLFDLGVSNTSGNMMALEVSKVQRYYIFKAGWEITTASYFFALFILSVIGFFVDWVSVFDFSVLDSETIFYIVLGLSSHVFIVGQMQSLSAVYKAERKYPEVIFFLNTVRLFEWGGALIVAYLGGGFFGFVLSLFSIRVLGFFLLVAFTYQQIDKRYILVLFKKYSGEKVSLISASGANFSSSIAVMISVQGTILILSSAWSGAAVAAFNVMRVLSRVIVQAATVVSQASWAEFSYAAAEGDHLLVKGILGKARLLAFIMSVILGLFLCFFAQGIVNFWLGNEAFAIDERAFYFLVTGAVVHSLWQVGWVYMMALNKHVRFSYVMSVVVALSMLVLFFVAKFESFLFVSVCLLIMESSILLLERIFNSER